MALVDFKLPSITDGNLDDARERRQIKEYLYQLTEQLRFTLNNLDGDNFTDEFRDEALGGGNISEIVQRIEGAEAGVYSLRKQTAEGFSQMVSRGEIISAINQSAEQITISASKINLQGYVTFTNLSTAGGTVINGGNITTGSIQPSGSGALSVGGWTVTANSLYSGDLGTGKVTLTSGYGASILSESGSSKSLLTQGGLEIMSVMYGAGYYATLKYFDGILVGSTYYQGIALGKTASGILSIGGATNGANAPIVVMPYGADNWTLFLPKLAGGALMTDSSGRVYVGSGGGGGSGMTGYFGLEGIAGMTFMNGSLTNVTFK